MTPLENNTRYRMSVDVEPLLDIHGRQRLILEGLGDHPYAPYCIPVPPYATFEPLEIGVKPGAVGATIITHSGLYFDFLNPLPEQIDIYDIAHGLSMTCRFGGQCREFYSVAQHSVLVSQLVPPEHALAGLLHDALEAYIGDVVGPLKQLLSYFKVLEHRGETVLLAKFGISLPLDPSIKFADLRMLSTEKRDLTAGGDHHWNGLEAYPPMEERIVPLQPIDAKAAFLDRYFELTAGRPV